MEARLDFFSRPAVSEAAAIYRNYQYWFRLFRRAVHLASDILSGAVIKRNDRQRFTASLLLGRLSTSSQAGAFLARHGFTHDAAAQVRLSFEIFVLLRACCEQEGFWKRYLDSDLVYQHRLATAGQGLSTFSPAQKAYLKSTQERHAKEIAEKGAKAIKVEETARSLGMADEYNTVYRLTSPAVHTVPVILVDLIHTKSGQPPEIVLGPSREGVELHLFSLTEYLLRGSSYSANLLSVDRIARFKRIYHDLRSRRPALPKGWITDDSS